MAVGKCPLGVEVLAGQDVGLAGQRLADQLDRLRRQIGEVGERLVLHLAVLAIGMAQENGLVDLVLMLTTRSRNMHCTDLPSHKHSIAH